MRGIITKSVLVIDLEGFGSENVKFSVTKTNVLDWLSYCPERQYKIFCLNASTFAYYCWQLIKPIIPTVPQQKM